MFWSSQPFLRTFCTEVSCDLWPELSNAYLKGVCPRNFHSGLLFYEAVLNQDPGRVGLSGAKSISFSGRRWLRPVSCTCIQLMHVPTSTVIFNLLKKKLNHHNVFGKLCLAWAVPAFAIAWQVPHPSLFQGRVGLLAV